MRRANGNAHIVAIGGGRGTAQVLLSAQPYFAQRTAVIAVTDTGRSTGIARQIANIPAPGDLRSVIAATAADGNDMLVRLLDYRFDSPEVAPMHGMAFGNLLLAALAQMTGDFARAVEIMAAWARSTAHILPVTTAHTHLCAELEDGQMMVGELAVRGHDKAPIRRVFLADSEVSGYAPALAAIRAADMVVIGPGSFFTSLLATLVVPGVVEAMRESRGLVVFVCNTTTQTGQTDGLRVIDHVRHLVSVLGPHTLDAALVNRTENLDAALVARYAEDRIYVLEPDDAELEAIAALGVRTIVRDCIERTSETRTLWQKQDTLRHDPTLLGDVLWGLYQDR